MICLAEAQAGKMLIVGYQFSVKKEAEHPSSGDFLNFEIITTVYEGLVSRLTRLFSHAMIHVLFYYCTLQGVIYE